MPDREKVINGINKILEETDEYDGVLWDALALLQEQKHKDKMFHALEDDWKRLKELLKEQEAVIKQWTKEIADSQLAHAPNDSPMSLDEQLECEYKRGIWDGLEIAWNIISEGR